MSDPNRKLRVGVLFGGRSGEHEVSLMSARSVISALDRDQYEVIEIGITHEGVWIIGQGVLEMLERGASSEATQATILPTPLCLGLYSMEGGPETITLEFASRLDVIFPVLHGTFGEDGTLQGLLELADLPYVGAGVLASAVGMDKGLFKDVMVAHRIPVLETVVVLRSEIESHLESVLERAEKVAPYPLFVKPANLGSSVGVSKCRNRSELIEGLYEASQYDRRVLIERGIEAREIEVSVIGNEAPEASIPGEIIPSREFYSYEAKYLDNASQLLIPAPISEALATRVRELAVQVYQAVDCAGMARVDFLLDKRTHEVYVSEINTIPGFTQISMYPKLWEASGLPYPRLLDRLIALALERKRERDRTIRRYHRGS